ncbi:MAG TPA: DUF222 domain-containing protein [Candidatus Dormibacteraeota bacterium]|nr:DUF222 domain-containing protein [Candidatus Dormibacteraeota bacterium]
MAATADRLEAARTRAVGAIGDFAAVLRTAEGAALGEGLVQAREMKDQLEAVFVEGLGRFDRSGEYAADGAIDLVSWLRSKCRVSGGDAAQRVGMARQLPHLPETQKAFATGELGFQHVAALARAAEHVGTAAVQHAEGSLLRLAQQMDPGEFTGAVKSFEHQVDAAAVLAEANRAHERRYLRLSDRSDGMIRLDGLLDAEGGAIVRTTLNAAMLPGKNDERTPDRRRADALVEACRGTGATRTRTDGSGPRPQLIIRTSVDTLAGLDHAPAGEVDSGGMIAAETVRRIACDSAVIRITGKGELEGERGRAARTIPPATRRVLALRDRGCVAEHCNRPPSWTDAHHIKHWAQGGPTTLSNLILLCRPHHRMVHEAGWTLQKLANGRWALMRPLPRSRSA